MPQFSSFSNKQVKYEGRANSLCTGTITFMTTKGIKMTFGDFHICSDEILISVDPILNFVQDRQKDHQTMC